MVKILVRAKKNKVAKDSIPMLGVVWTGEVVVNAFGFAYRFWDSLGQILMILMQVP